MPKLIYETRDRIAWVTLNRPEARNAIDPAGDDQLRIEALNGYSCVANPEIPGRLKHFYDKTDRGRAGAHTTEL